MTTLTKNQKLVEKFRTQDEGKLNCEGHQALWNYVLCKHLPEEAFRADAHFDPWAALLGPIVKTN